jgi:hypothetical protein
MIRVLFLLLAATLAHADDYAPYDGPSGITRDYYNLGATFKWRRTGGDWRDVSGAMYGSQAYASASIAAAQTGEVLLDVSPIMRGDGYMLRGAGGPIAFGSRESEKPPRLIYTLADGGEFTVTPIADSTIDTSTSYAVGQRGTLGINAAIVFPVAPLEAIAAKLVLTITSATGKGSVGVMELVVPRSAALIEDPCVGFADDYPGDIGIASHPWVVWAENFDVGEVENWWTRTPPIRKDVPSRWTTDGGLFPYEQRDIMRDAGGYAGTQGLKQTLRANAIWGTGTPTFYPKIALGAEMEEAYVRYYLKFGADFRDTPVCDGGKLPGITSNTTYCGNSGRPADGYCGWSMRQEFKMNCDAGNPIYPKVIVTIYAYHVDQKGLYGDILAGTPVTLDEWHCIEERVKVNTPGEHDGIVQQWIDGKLVIDRHDFMMRKALDAAHPAYAPADSALAIAQAPWGTHHWGGKNPPGKEVHSWIDNMVTATKRIGCLR